MNTAIFFDTETTGLPLFKEPSDHPNQPHIVQIAACLVDMDTRKTISSMDVIVKPDGWVIPDDVSAIHSITTEHALDVGISEQVALDMFMQLWSGRLRIAHNESFDARIIRIAQKRYGVSEEKQNEWSGGLAECTCMMATPIVQAPPTERMQAVGRTHFKKPTLSESYLHFMGKPLDGAHSAMSDVVGCMEVYFAIKDLK